MCPELHPIRLPGCQPTPLASYLKSLGVLRLVSEQADPSARGWWAGDMFHLESRLSADELIDFFLHHYRPTPLVAPWNGGSGFYEGDNISARDAILHSPDERIAEYRKTIAMVQTWNDLLPQENMQIAAMIAELRAVSDKKTGKAKDALVDLLMEWTEQSATAFAYLQSIGAQDGLGQLSISDIEKFKPLFANSAPEQAKSLAAAVNAAKKIRSQFKGLERKDVKNDLIQACRSRLPARAADWVDAAAVISSSKSALFPPLLGTGGNEGRLDYTNTFMSRIVDVLLLPMPADRAQGLIRNSIMGELLAELSSTPVGQFDPGRAGGFNQGFGIKSDSIPVNPWDTILTMEGALVWASNIVRRQSLGIDTVLSSPFTVQTRGVGYGSATENDDANARAEIWAPLWNRPATYHEIKAFFGEGRAEIGRKQARNTIEFAKAATSLGVDRGIDEFVRHVLLKRRGESYIAMPAGRFPVRHRSESDLVRQLDTPLQRLDSFLRSFKNPPASLTSARRNIDEAIYRTLLRGGAVQIRNLIAAIGRMERLIAARDPSRSEVPAAPLFGMKPAWIAAAEAGGSLEVRIAAALASLASCGAVGPMRANVAPVNPEKPQSWGKGRGQTAWRGNTFTARLASVMQQRLMDASRLNVPATPLFGWISVHPRDIAAFIAGDVDEELCEQLMFGFTWIAHQEFRQDPETTRQLRGTFRKPMQDRPVPRAFSLLKLIFAHRKVPSPAGGESAVRPEPAILPLLLANRIEHAGDIAYRRLFASGLAPMKFKLPDRSADGLRLAASLLIPTEHFRWLARRVLQPSEVNHTAS